MSLIEKALFVWGSFAVSSDYAFMPLEPVQIMAGKAGVTFSQNKGQNDMALMPATLRPQQQGPQPCLLQRSQPMMLISQA